MGKNKKLHVCYILDQSGSMLDVMSQTISGYNEYLATMQGDEKAKEALLTLTLFNSEEVKVVYTDEPIKNVARLSNATYKPAEWTPLYDAIGKTIKAMEQKIGGKKQSVLVVIHTDGLENASHEYSREGIFKLIDEKKKDGWTFTFLGANQDAYASGAALGIAKGNTSSYDPAHTTTTMRGIAMAACAFASLGDDDDDKKERLVETYVNK